MWKKLKVRLGLSRPDRSSTTRPNRPTVTRFRPEPKVQSVGSGFLFSRTDTGGSSGGFASPKPEQPEPDRSCIKNEAKPAKSSQIQQDLYQIWRDLDQIWLDLVGFRQILPIPAIFSEKFQIPMRKNANTSEIFQISAWFSKSQQDFPDSGNIFQIPAIFFKFRQLFFSDLNDFFLLRRSTEPTDAHTHPKPTWPIFPTVGSGFLHPPTQRQRVESGLGPKLTWPNPWTALGKVEI